MKIQYWQYILIVLIISGCFPSDESNISTQSPIQFTPVVPTPNHTLESQPPQTMTLTPLATLNPQQTEEMLQQLLREPKDCLAPCFWGIVPEKTTLSELEKIITSWGLPFGSTQNNGWDFYGTIYNFDNGISILATFPVQNDVVNSARIKLNLQGYKPSGSAREWESYSPETLVNQYGHPSSVDITIYQGPRKPGDPYLYYFMTIRFDAVNLIVEYSYGKMEQSFRVCPLSDEFWGVHLWFGKKPLNPPSSGVALEQAAALSMSDFSDLLLGDSEKACFNLSSKVIQ